MMKKIILSLSVLSIMLLLSNCTIGKSKNKGVEVLDENAIVEIPDANFKAYLLESFDINKDGEISISEANAVVDIDCSNRNIKDLTGIQKFINLERLNCNNNLLEELELRYNKKLNRLVCTNNVEPLFVYFAFSSPIRNKNFNLPQANTDPEADIKNPIDVSKCIFDASKTNFVVVFDH